MAGLHRHRYHRRSDRQRRRRRASDLAGQVLPGIDLIAGTESVSTDPNGHGTHVAGTIAAVTGNGAGVAAVVPDAKILPIRALGADGSGYMSDTETGIGTKVQVVFTVKANGKAWARKTVQVCDAAGCRARTTSSSGAVTSDSATVKGRYAVYLKVPATTTSTAVTSAASTFKAGAAVSATRHSKTAMRVNVTGAVGQTVRIQRLSGKTWVTVETYRATRTPRSAGWPPGSSTASWS